MSNPYDKIFGSLDGVLKNLKKLSNHTIEAEKQALSNLTDEQKEQLKEFKKELATLPKGDIAGALELQRKFVEKINKK